MVVAFNYFFIDQKVRRYIYLHEMLFDETNKLDVNPPVFISFKQWLIDA